MHRPLVRSLLVCAALAGCDAATPPDAGNVDAPEPLDAALDASSDASRDAAVADAPPLDAPGLDAPRSDGGRDAPGPRLDAGPELAAAVAQALDLVCGVPARGACSAPWLCGCDVSSPPPLDAAACERAERTACEDGLRDTLTAFFARGGVTVDEEALATCVALADQSYEQCLPRPASAADQPASCWDAFVLGTAVGSPCDVSGVRCADGAGVCAGRVCTAAGDAVGAPCFGTCTAGLVCLDGTCADPVAAAGACSDHEDCAASELCVGGRCAPPVSAGGRCDGADRCVTGAACQAGSCRTAGPSCVVGGDASCGSGAECRAGSITTCQPRRGAGEPCFGSDEECASELTCDTATRFPGACTPAPGAGEPCVRTCASGLVCLTPDFSSARCELPRGLGASCAGIFARAGSVCEDGLGCVGGTCGPLPRLGEPCSEESRCEAGLACLVDRVTFLQRCELPLSEGADCSSTGSGCAEGLYCDFTFFSSVCRALPSEGQECTGTCAPGLDCRFFSALSRSICVPVPGLGEECGGACAGEAFCAADVSAGRCVQRICDLVSPGGGPFPPVEPF